MPSTYTPIATTTLGSTTSTVTFSSIPSTYTDLILVVNGGITSSGYPTVRFNNDSGSNYSFTSINGNGSSALSQAGANRNAAVVGGWLNYWPTTVTATSIVQIQNYSNATTYKSLLARDNYSASEVGAYVNLWRSTAAVNRIDVFSSASTFIVGSTFTLYGVKSA